MTISKLEITSFRNILLSSIEASRDINIFYGLNGSGKTSVLEAIHFLALGRSFRTKHMKRAINNTSDKFSLFANIHTDSNGLHIPVGLERHKNGSQELRIAEKPGQSILEIASLLPIQFINSESHRLLTGGPLVRRQYLDWGVFHLEPLFYSVWQRLHRSLKQRNAAMKAKQPASHVQLWDHEIVLCSQHLDEFRQNYIAQLNTIFHQIVTTLLPDVTITLNYFRGWNETQDLSSLLESSLMKDMYLGYTQFGAHRCDILILCEAIPAHEVLSQGQQKLIAYTLRLSQGILLKQQSNKSCIYLIDDLPAELDHKKRSLVAEVLQSIGSQVFVTGIDPGDLDSLKITGRHKMFHVEHGKVSETQPHEL